MKGKINKKVLKTIPYEMDEKVEVSYITDEFTCPLPLDRAP
jgi:hypothetical protein